MGGSRSNKAFSGVASLTGPGPRQVVAGGLADRAERTPWTTRTRTQLGSVSKQVVAVVALALAERNALDLDTGVRAAWPDAPRWWEGVTLRQLLHHTAGVPHWGADPGFVVNLSLDPEERVDRILAAPPRTGPGAAWAYSSPGYLVAAAMIERLSGASYPDLAEELVVAELELSATRVGAELEAGAAIGYDGVEQAPRWDLARMPGTGDLTSTADDVATFVERLHAGDLVDVGPASDFAATIPTGLPDETGSDGVVRTGYGLGHFEGTIAGRRAVICPGDNPGYHAVAAWLPDARTCLVVLGNDESQDIDRTAASLLG